MSAIRPLATIAMLMVLGYFLWTRINTPGLEATTEGELAAIDLPPLALDSGGAAPTMAASPPAFSPATAAAGESSVPEFEFGPTPATQARASSGITPLTPADTVAMPDLPPLPAEVPIANYADNQPSSGSVSGQVPSLGTAVPSSAVATRNALPPLDASDPLAEAATATAGEPPMGVRDEFAASESAFAAARTAIQAALERGELERAHLLLSGWYGDRSLTAAELQEVDNLLGQLAGTVVYSPEHRLEAPHTVQPGETLETIAQKYNVPWQLLAKINGVSQPSAVAPGQEFKVVRGPFSAVVDIERQQLALMVADRYAGKFSVKTEGDAASEGEWMITQKQMPSGYSSAAKQMVLEPTGGAGGTSLVLGTASDSAPAAQGAIRVAPTDQEDLFDILSIGSKVIIRR